MYVMYVNWLRILLIQQTDEMYRKDNNALQIGPFSVKHVETNLNGAVYTEMMLTLVHDKEVCSFTVLSSGNQFSSI